MQDKKKKTQNKTKQKKQQPAKWDLHIASVFTVQEKLN